MVLRCQAVELLFASVGNVHTRHLVQGAMSYSVRAIGPPKTAPNAAKRLVDRLRVRKWSDPYSCRTGASPDGKGDVVLSIWLASIFKRAFVMSLALGLRLDCILTMRAELTVENKPAWMRRSTPI